MLNSTMNLPSNVLKLMLSSCTQSTWQQYESVLKKYVLFCNNESLDSSKPCISSILRFLTSLFESKYSYTYINIARSSLSTLLPHIDGLPVGQHPLVIRLIKGVGRLRPPKPRYDSVWDVSKVLELFNNWPSNDKLSLCDLSLKLVALLALVTAQRSQTLFSINVSNILFGDVVKIRINTQLKTFRPGQVQPMLVLKPYFVNEKLCVVSCLKEYLTRTRVLRKKEDKLFVSYSSPHKYVSTQTLSRWLCRILSKAGIDTNEFKGHSFRHVATSKAAEKGIPIDTILKKAGWCAGSKVFAKYYNKPIREDNFAHAVLHAN